MALRKPKIGHSQPIAYKYTSCPRIRVLPENTPANAMSSNSELLRLSAMIVSAHASKNPVSMPELSGVIHSVYRALASVGAPVAEEMPPQPPAVPIKRSVFPSYIVCLEDGKKLKMLKRHLMSSYGMTPDEYRAKWKLPSSYPMVAPDYAERRSTLAKENGLGRKDQGSLLPGEPIPAEPPIQRIPEGKRGRRPSAKLATDQPDMLDEGKSNSAAR
jgi:predicted transcriptional regulator